MLTKKEKEEIIIDGLSLKRRKEFAQFKKINSIEAPSFDEYIRFLTSIQKVFSSFAISRGITITKFNKL
jgi:hypothetical protein